MRHGGIVSSGQVNGLRGGACAKRRCDFGGEHGLALNLGLTLEDKLDGGLELLISLCVAPSEGCGAVGRQAGA